MAILLRRIPPLRRTTSIIKCISNLSTVAHAAVDGKQPTNPNFQTHPPLPSSSPNATPNPNNNPNTTTIPPGFHASTANLPIFTLPTHITPSSPTHLTLGQALIHAWRRDGIIQIAMDATQRQLWADAHAASRAFFRRPHAQKAACVDDRSYAGYIASGEEVTDGVADYSEVFTVTKDLGVGDARVRAGWPCHGPCPWPEDGEGEEGEGGMREVMGAFKRRMGEEGERLLGLAELGLGVGEGALRRYTRDGWHHMRVLRFPARTATNGKGKKGRGIGSHTDYGLLVIAAQDEVGGLFIRRPSQDEKFANWEKSAAGLNEDDDSWVYVPPVEGVHTVILGDMMQYLTHDYLKATPHKVGLNTRERFSVAYFHEPSFQAVVKPLEEGCGGLGKPAVNDTKGIHYGTHFTNMFLRSYPDRITTRRLLAEGRCDLLKRPELRTIGAAPA
ncbi:uncharacterized protein B0H64DRAFT_443676 [Chaetomium fimeti]|uniref:Fe2OG dioxygenase domain-containing protein n=1 Tax=Chaetomium fimeti TaxID=1854472 RepID=A0AAE0HDX0_9PEZI|nr:hypothetical protein B0H64DRAFT_443676 [Chaetomium fimeti]